MNLGTKVGVYLVLALLAVFLGQRFYAEYSRSTASAAKRAPAVGDDVVIPEYRVSGGGQESAGATQRTSRMGAYGAAFFVVVVVVGVMVGNDISKYFGARALRTLFNDEGEGIADPEYDKAEAEWANGNHLEAIRLMRDFLNKNPREQHVSLRIAEIYEKDLQNHLAAALEYEEVLKQRLSPERWGWAAIHLCNVYSSKLGQPDKGVALLRRIVDEYGETAAAEKARKRLLEVDGASSEVAQSSAAAAEEQQVPRLPASTGTSLPPGFTPKKR
jgi:hypothetical protein